MAFDYDSWITQARERLELLYDQKNAIENEIAALEKGIEGFLPLTKHAWLGPTAGLTDSVMKVFNGQPHKYWGAVEIRNELINRGMSLDQRNPIANIHQILARLHERGVIEPRVIEGKTRYRWSAGPLTRAAKKYGAEMSLANKLDKK